MQLNRPLRIKDCTVNIRIITFWDYNLKYLDSSRRVVELCRASAEKIDAPLCVGYIGQLVGPDAEGVHACGG